MTNQIVNILTIDNKPKRGGIKMDIEEWQITQRLNLPLNIKEELAMKRIREFYDYNNGKVYVAFSGGKDSTVLLHLARRVKENIEGVFADTGLEFPEIKDFVKTKKNITTVRPKIPFTQVIKKYGYPVISKNVSRYVRDLKNPTDRNQKTRNIRLGLTGSKVGTLSKKWRFMINAPFKCSEQCCNIMKKNPMKKFNKDTGRFPIIGTMIGESNTRKIIYKRTGCFNKEKNQLTPISFFTEENIWEYIKKYNLDYSKIYDMGETRTGCVFCMFGVQFDHKISKDGKNRFQRMENSHPQLYNYCMNKLGIKDVLKFINIPSSNKE